MHAWLFFAVFAGVVLALVLEPLPASGVGLLGVTIVAITAPWTFFSPAELVALGADAPARAIAWAVSGFSNTTIWLSFSAFLFAAGYQKTGLGRRIALLLVRSMGRRTILLGYAITLADLILAPFTPSNTARSAGTIFPIIRNLPPLYRSHPNSRSARRIGGYVMWTALAATSVTSSMFLTALAPNVLAVELIRAATQVEITWLRWFIGFAPAGLFLLLVLPLLVFLLYPPDVRTGTQAVGWAVAELNKIGPMARSEYLLAGLIFGAILSWVFADAYVHATTVALAVVGLMLVFRLLSWDDVLTNHEAWKALILLATLVTLANGLSRTGFVTWFATGASGVTSGMSPISTMIILMTVYFSSHYLFASITAHVTAIMPIMLEIGARTPGVPMEQFALLLAFSHGLMGVLTPYATTSGPVYLGSGYISTLDFWRLGLLFGCIFLGGLLLLSAPFLLWKQ